MSQLRTGLRAYAIDGLQPAEVVRKLHRLADQLLEGASARRSSTSIFDPATRELRYVSAGHLPVLHVDAGGESSFLDGRRARRRSARSSADVDVPQDSLVLSPGESVLLYTDGLVERRDEGLTEPPRTAARRDGQRARRPRRLPRPRDGGAHGRGVRMDDVALLALRRAHRGRL